MKITAIVAPFGADFGLNAAFSLVCDTLRETGEDMQIFNLASIGLDHYHADSTQKIVDIMENIKDTDGVIFAFPAVYNMPGALALTFLEYFCDDAYNGYFWGKPCLLLGISENGGERNALEAVATALLQLGAHDVVRIALNAAAASVVKGDVIELIERQTEDFYRILRQNRRYVFAAPQSIVANPTKSASETFRAPINLDEIYEKHQLGTITDEQKGDIDKITEIFAKKFITNPNDEVISEQKPVAISSMQQGFGRTPKQLTAALSHHFNPHLAKDVNAVIQLNISGAGGFEGFLTITPQYCNFDEGNSEASDILIIADAKAWGNVLAKKITAQKAFMMGQLKVRGNFVLLTKFDQMFI